VELIARAKQAGVPVTAETCPHYLLWDEELVSGYFTLAKVNPPLRTSDDVLALRQAVREGVIDILVTDHAPHADFEKDAPFAQAPNGISGLDTALSLSWSLVKDQILSPEELIRLWSTAPAAIYGLKTNSFTPGDPADICIFDPDTVWTVSSESMASKGKNTPCLGQTLPGRVQALMLQGRLIYEHA
jgi:dihydroorotase